MRFVRWLKHLFMESIDARLVRMYQGIMYLACFMFGIYALFFLEPTSPIEQTLGTFAYNVFIWLNIVCPIMVALGCYLAWSKITSHITTQQAEIRSRKKASGYVLQLTGDIGMLSLVTAQAFAWSDLAIGGRGDWTEFNYWALSLCAAMLVATDVRKILKVGRTHDAEN